MTVWASVLSSIHLQDQVLFNVGVFGVHLRQNVLDLLVDAFDTRWNKTANAEPLPFASLQVWERDFRTGIAILDLAGYRDLTKEETIASSNSS